MATISPDAGYNALDIQGDGSVIMYKFSSLTTTNADTSPIQFAQWADRCVQVTGTFGSGGTIVVEGSNDGSTYATLNDAQGNAISLTAAGLKQIIEVPRYARARVTAGDGTTSLVASFVLRRANPMRA